MMTIVIAVQRHIISKQNMAGILIEQTQDKSIRLEQITGRHEIGY